MRRHNAWREFLLLITVVLVVSTSVKLFFVQAFFVPSGSMENTVDVGDRVVVDKLTPWFGSQPTRGEVVVFQDPGGWLEQQPASHTNLVVSVLKQSLILVGLLPEDGQGNLIKRVVGLPGDHVVCCNAQHQITVNGVPLTEPYLFPGDAPSLQTFDIVVPPGRIWVMGDHRSDSADSRAHINDMFSGTVPESDVVGRAIAVVWPFGRLHMLSVPATFNQNFAADSSGLPALPVDPATASVLASTGLLLVRRRRRGSMPCELLDRWTVGPSGQARRTGVDRLMKNVRLYPFIGMRHSGHRGIERVMVGAVRRRGRPGTSR